MHQFLERDDNSSCLPGKRDATKSKAGTTQTRVLNDYLYSLHLKFKSENPGIRISLTTFSSMCPRYMKLVHFSSRKTCLCQKHQNIALKVKGLKSVGAITTDSPDVMIQQSTDESIIQKIKDCEANTIKYSEWKRKEVEHKGRTTKRMIIESVEIPKDRFVEMLKFVARDLKEFRKHTEKVKCQYEQVKLLKDNLPENHAICQMDFAENYSCGHAEEIQTAYFDKCSVTLHPVVIYTKTAEENVTHSSYIYVSDTGSHNAGTVFAFMKRINEDLKSKHPNIECVHYITDSPTSQYRNKSMMYLVANHDKIFGLKASLQYWEAGHGKGPCDGVGDIPKRLADLAVKRQTAVIQSAQDYYNWGSSLQNSQTKYVFVPKEECDNAHTQITSFVMKPIKGTMDIHSVVQMIRGTIGVRNTSCFCKECFENGAFKAKCEGWTFHSIENGTRDEERETLDGEQETLTQGQETEAMDAQETGPNHQHTDAVSSNQVDYSLPLNTYVAAKYNDNWYVGKIVSHDQDDSDFPYQVDFMEHGKGKGSHTVKWPSHKDVIWRSREQILCVIQDPVPYGTRKMFKLLETNVQIITEAFEHSK